jgi:hypothetical protein
LRTAVFIVFNKLQAHSIRQASLAKCTQPLG